jgi:hypothetical protein
MDGVSTSDVEMAALQIALALAFLAGAGLSVSRPGPSRTQVWVYRIAYVGVPSVVAGLGVIWYVNPF